MLFVGATWNRLFQEINVIDKIFKSMKKFKQVSLAWKNQLSLMILQKQTNRLKD